MGRCTECSSVGEVDIQCQCGGLLSLIDKIIKYNNNDKSSSYFLLIFYYCVTHLNALTPSDVFTNEVFL